MRPCPRVCRCAVAGHQSPEAVQIEVSPMIRATIIALIVLTWCDELMSNGQYTRAAFQVSRSMARYMFNV